MYDSYDAAQSAAEVLTSTRRVSEGQTVACNKNLMSQ